MACVDRANIVYSSIIFRKYLFYNEKVILNWHGKASILCNKKGPIKDEPFKRNEPKHSHMPICRSFAP